MTDRREYKRKYYAENKERRKEKNKEHSRKYKANNKEKVKEANRKYHLFTKFRLTEQEYNTMIEEHNYSCAICGKHQDDCCKRLSVDHDHESGEIRGLLCANCNFGLGSFFDSPENLSKALEYISKAIGVGV